VPVFIHQAGAGQTSIAAGAGVTINATSTLNARTQNAVMFLIQTDTDVWLLGGETA
jgi:hypothetical protein